MVPNLVPYFHKVLQKKEPVAAPFPKRTVVVRVPYSKSVQDLVHSHLDSEPVPRDMSPCIAIDMLTHHNSKPRLWYHRDIFGS